MTHLTLFRSRPALWLLAVLAILGSGLAQAATIGVNTATDPAGFNNNITIAQLGTTVTLRDAVNAVRNSGGTHTITFAASLAGQTITLLQQDPAGGAALVPHQVGLPAKNLTLQGLTGNSGVTIARDQDAPLMSLFGCVGSDLTLTVNDLTFTGGNATAGSGWGGAFNITGGSTVTLNRCTLRRNAANLGGAIQVRDSTLTVTNCTIFDNAANQQGGGIYHHTGGAVTLTHTTIAENTGFNGGGLYTFNGGALLVNTIVTSNSSYSSGANIDIVGNGNIALSPSSRNNLVGNAATSGGLINGVNGNIVGADAQLRELGSNGGPTWTMGLAVGSPALNAAASGVVGTDQRGITRPQGAGADIGAYELVPGAPTTFTSPDRTAFVIGFDKSFNVTADGTPSPTFSISGALPAGISFDASGLLSGNPNTGTEGTYPLTITASNSAGTFVQSFTLTVIPTIVVTTAVDEDNGSADPALNTGTSLREAINFANSENGQSLQFMITFAPSLAGQSINLTFTADTASFGPSALRINKNITIQGLTGSSGITIRRATAGDLRPFVVSPGATLTLNDLTVADGRASSAGGIWNLGTLRMNRCTMRNNSARGSGGALLSSGFTGQTREATLTNCTIVYNTAQWAGGIDNGPDSTLTLVNTTITVNRATNTETQSIRGAGIDNAGTVVLINSIVAANTADGTGPSDVRGGINASASSHHNLFGTGGSGGLVNGINGNIILQQAHEVRLALLESNGGPVQTMALHPGSPAIDAGATISGVVTDARGVFRGASGGGLRGRFYSIPGGPSTALLSPLSNLEALPPNATAPTPRVDFGAGTETVPGDGTVLDRGGSAGNLFGGLNVNVGTNNIAALWDGFIAVPQTATYRFTTRSDDGSVLYIDDQLVVNNNFFQPPTNRSGTVSLTAGLHTIRIGFTEGSQGATMQASWEQLDGTAPFGRQIIPPNVLSFVNAAGTVPDIGAFELIPSEAASIPSFTPLGGTYENTVQVSIASPSVNAIVRYTLDGSTPSSSNGLIYSGPFTLTSNATLRAIAYGRGWLASPIASVTYSVLPPLAFWRNLHGLAANGSQDLANPSRDGVANLLKYAFNMAPNLGDLAVPNIRVLPENGTAGLPFLNRDAQGRLVVEFIRRKAATNPGISYLVQTGDDLTNLTPLSLSGAGIVSIDVKWERVTVTDPTITPRRFGLVRVLTP